MLRWSAVFFSALIATARGAISTGTDFYFAFPCQLFGTANPYLIVVNTDSNPSMVTIDSSVSGFQQMERTVNGNSALQIGFTEENAHIILGMQVCDENTVNQQGFEVKTSAAVSLYVVQGTDGGLNLAQFMVLPSNMLSNTYMGSLNNHYYSIIIAKQDGTQVTVGGTTVTMKRLDVYYSYAVMPTTANFPFACILTISSDPISQPSSSVMALPKTHGGTLNSIAPSAYGTNLNAQIWSIAGTASVSINGQANFNVAAGTPFETPSFGKVGGAVTSNIPVQVLSWYPYIDYAVSTDMFLSSNMRFYTTSTNEGSPPVVMIVAPLSSTGNIQIDDQAIPALQYKHIPNAREHYYYIKPLSYQATLHRISITTLDDRYLAYVFYPGYGGTLETKYVIALNLTISP